MPFNFSTIQSELDDKNEQHAYDFSYFMMEKNKE
jgi:hypothetical protein